MGGSTNKKFAASGPKHISLFNLDWNDEEHCRIITSCLVKGVYVLESDREKHRMGEDTLAPAWWSSFHFVLCQTLEDPVSETIFGAIFEHKESAKCHAPRFIVAFRGTLFKKIYTGDIQVNLNLVMNDLNQHPRLEVALESVRKLATESTDIWLTGHSLGASVALKVGRTMVSEMGLFPRTILYNPPFPKVVDSTVIGDNELKEVVDVADGILKVAGSFIYETFFPEKAANDTFHKLVEWRPQLYIHAKDPICNKYLEYFQKRKEMEEKGGLTGAIGKKAAGQSKTRLMSNMLGKKHHEALHKIPSAILMENVSPPVGSIKVLAAHKLKQWWMQNQIIKKTEYIYEE